ncbi:MAG: hypothetical protein JWM05_3393 [Acidimicrobiales bacterium]|nr:hypothetical protein [Acidimicrobiales bacterium]
MPDPLLDAFADLNRHLEDCPPLDVTLQRVVEIAQATQLGTGEIGIAIFDHGEFRDAPGSGPAAIEVDEAQFASDTGPGLEAHRLGHVVEVPDMQRASKWPEFRQAALGQGFGSSLSVPLSIGPRRMGVLNSYRGEVAAYSPEVSALAVRLAHQAALALAHIVSFRRLDALVGQLEEALESRDVIGQAKGMLMAQRHIDAEQAHALLVASSRERNLKLRKVADEVAASRVLLSG